MAYFAPYIDDDGLHIPTYQDIKDDLVTEAKKFLVRTYILKMIVWIMNIYLL